MRRVGRTVIVCWLLAALALAGAGPAAGQEADGFGGSPFQTGDVNPDTVVLRADVAENGTASWTVQYRIRLDDRNTTAAFESLRADVERNRSAYRSRFGDRMKRTAAVAETATGRRMAVENVSVATERRQLPQEYGVVDYRFRWTNFAAVDGSTIRIGDALAGLFLDSETQLVLSWPAGAEATDVRPAPDERTDTSVTWRGPTDFSDDEPQVVVQSASGTPPKWLFAALTVVVLGVGGVWFRRRIRTGENETPGSDTDESGTDDDGSVATDSSSDDATESEPKAAATRPPEELLSPRERVVRFVEERGGRVKQQELVRGFDWTAARTSQIIGELRDNGEIETFRLGRENVVTLPEADEGEDDGSAS